MLDQYYLLSSTQTEMISMYLDNLNKKIPYAKIDISVIEKQTTKIYNKCLKQISHCFSGQTKMNSWCFSIYTDKNGIDTLIKILKEKLPALSVELNTDLCTATEDFNNDLTKTQHPKFLISRWDLNFFLTDSIAKES